ncbi:hypothetical protein C8R46DRAFT_1077964 [Mycena filopes]|nr:hypothetical protein C8R46DRAFT_1077964 [Mycena filopes]
MDDLPVELIDQVLDNLEATSDRMALALVSRAFAHPAQRRLFRVLTLSSPEDVKELKQLSIILSDNPDLGLHVRDLFIELELGTPAVCAPLVRILRLLKAVRRVTIAPRIEGLYQSWLWAHWPTDLQMALTTLLTLPSMRGLVLVQCCGVPAALIRYGIASYTEMALQVTDIDFHKIKFPKGSDGPSLEHLVLDYSPVKSHSFHTLLLSDDVTASLGRLKRLELILHEQGQNSFDAPKAIIRKYSSSLRHITITPRCLYTDFDLSTIDLPDLPSLKSLGVRTHLTRRLLSATHSLLRFIIALPPRTPRLQFLTITLDFIDDDIMNWMWNEDPSSPLTDVDDALLRLSEVCFRLPAPHGLASGEELMRKKLPRASQAGILSFTRHLVPTPQIEAMHTYAGPRVKIIAWADTFAELCEEIM